MKWAMFILTLISCAYAIYCQRMMNVFKNGFLLLAKTAYNPKTKQDVYDIIQRMMNEYEHIRPKDTDTQ